MIPLPLVLKANSWFSLISGGILAVSAPQLEPITGVEVPWLIGVGVGVALFGLLVRRAATEPINSAEVLLVVVADLVWVAGAAALIFLVPDALTTTGKWVLAIVSILVLDFASFQLLGLARSGRKAAA